jgi:hypothetical protein
MRKSCRLGFRGTRFSYQFKVVVQGAGSRRVLKRHVEMRRGYYASFPFSTASD